MIDFVGFGKIGRLKKNCVITEKLDGTNGQIKIKDDLSPYVLDSGREVPFMVGSRNKWIFPESDNAGFARWAYENASELLKLGPGSHFGEWWGQKIQRTYGLKEKRFSLFNVGRWWDNPDLPSCCYVVPILYVGPFNTDDIQQTMLSLKQNGSSAAPGFMDPEGIIIYHEASRTLFKSTFDDNHKGDVDSAI